MTRPIENLVEVETQGNLSLWIDRPIYQIYKTTCGYVRNTRTGENMGTTVELHMNLYDDEYNKLDVATYEEDCYEFVEGENDGTIYE